MDKENLGFSKWSFFACLFLVQSQYRRKRWKLQQHQHLNCKLVCRLGKERKSRRRKAKISSLIFIFSSSIWAQKFELFTCKESLSHQYFCFPLFFPFFTPFFPITCFHKKRQTSQTYTHQKEKRTSAIASADKELKIKEKEKEEDIIRCTIIITIIITITIIKKRKIISCKKRRKEKEEGTRWGRSSTTEQTAKSKCTRERLISILHTTLTLMSHPYSASQLHFRTLSGHFTGFLSASRGKIVAVRLCVHCTVHCNGCQ